MESKSFSKIPFVKLRTILLRTTIILFAISALLAIIAILISSNEFTYKALATTLFLSLFSLINTNNIMRLNHEQKIVKITSLTALIANVVWLFILLFILWGPIQSVTVKTLVLWTIIWDVTLTGLTIAITSTIISRFVCFYAIEDSAIQALASLTIISSNALSLLWLINIWFWPHKAFAWQLYAIFSILLIFGAIITPILVKVRYGSPPQEKEPPLSREELRAEIEREVRAQIAAEQATKQTLKQATTKSAAKNPKSSAK